MPEFSRCVLNPHHTLGDQNAFPNSQAQKRLRALRCRKKILSPETTKTYKQATPKPLNPNQIEA